MTLPADHGAPAVLTERPGRVLLITINRLSQAEGRALMTSADAADGPRAFAEKRVPSWEGR